MPRTAAVIVTCFAGNYKANLQHAVKNIDLAELGIGGMEARRALTGAQIYEIKGPDYAQKADASARGVGRKEGGENHPPHDDSRAAHPGLR